MIYCVIPPELADELYDKMVEYYKDNPNVTVIVDRREGPDRRRGEPAGSFEDQRKIRKVLHYTGLPCDARSITNAVLQMEEDHDLKVLRVGIEHATATHAAGED